MGILFRALAAIAGGYAFSAAATALLAITLPLPRADAVMTATLLSFALYAGAAIWAFSARSALHAWIVLLLPASVMALATKGLA